MKYKKFHDVSVHDCINSMFSHISSEIYWKEMPRDVKEYVSGYLLFHMQLVYPSGLYLEIARKIMLTDLLSYIIH